MPVLISRLLNSGNYIFILSMAHCFSIPDKVQHCGLCAYYFLGMQEHKQDYDGGGLR